MIIKTRVRGKALLKVMRPPRMKTLRAHLFGLTLGLAAVFVQLVFAAPGQRTIGLLALWWVIGYFAGAVFGLLYNVFAYLFLKFIHPEWFKLWFFYDPKRVVNIIKTPIPATDWDAGAQELYKSERYKVFDFRSYDEIKDPVSGKTMKHPYTIVFVANPFIRLRRMSGGKVMAVRDPIMDNVSLFLKTVYRALYSFEYNEVIGRPDIFSKIRIVTVNESTQLKTKATGPVPYDTVREQSYVREFLGTFETEPNRDRAGPESETDTFAHRMLVPNLITRRSIRELVKKETGIEHIDVIFAISASPTHDMSTARVASNDWQKNQPTDGVYFTYSADPFCDKDEQILKNECETLLCQNPNPPKIDSEGSCSMSSELHRRISEDRVMIHEYFADPEGMGLVAMSAYDVRPKLPVHEFAHAMSSLGHGTIVDEYYDFAKIHEDEGEGEAGEKAEEQIEDEPVAPAGIVVNRIYRHPKVMRETHEVPVHKPFARYNGYVYESDRDHHIARQGWYSYFPGRKNPEVRCTMEAAEDVFQFDELLTDFIYDRLWVKVNRDFLMP